MEPIPEHATAAAAGQDNPESETILGAQAGIVDRLPNGELRVRVATDADQAEIARRRIMALAVFSRGFYMGQMQGGDRQTAAATQPPAGQEAAPIGPHTARLLQERQAAARAGANPVLQPNQQGGMTQPLLPPEHNLDVVGRFLMAEAAAVVAATQALLDRGLAPAALTTTRTADTPPGMAATRPPSPLGLEEERRR